MSSNKLHSFAIGLATLDENGEIIEVFYPQPMLSLEKDTISNIIKACGYQSGNTCIQLSREAMQDLSNDPTFPLPGELQESARVNRQSVIATFIEEDVAPTTVAEVYLKLHLLSHRLCKPHSVNLQGAFGVLRNIA